MALLFFVGAPMFAQSQNGVRKWPSEALKKEAEDNAKLLWEKILTKCGDAYYYAGSGLDNISKTGQPIPYKNALSFEAPDGSVLEGDVTKYEGVRFFVTPPIDGAAARENAARLGIVDGGVAVLEAETFASGNRQAHVFGRALDGPLSNVAPNKLLDTLGKISGAPGSSGSIQIQMSKIKGEWKFSLIGIMASDPRTIFELNPDRKFECKETKPREELSAVPRGCEIESSLRSTPDALGTVNLEIVNRTAGAVKVYSVDQNGIKASRGSLKINTSGTIVGPTNTFYVAKDSAEHCIEVVQTKTDDSIFRVTYPGQRGKNADQCPAWKATGFTPVPGDRVISVSSGVLQGNLISSVPPVYPEGVSAPATRPGEPIRVVLDARIGRDGHVLSISVENAPSCEFANAAIAAVSQWVYKPNSNITDAPINVTFTTPPSEVNGGSAPSPDSVPGKSPSPPSGSQLFREYSTACNNGDAKACAMVGYCYNHGREGVSKDPKLAKQ